MECLDNAGHYLPIPSCFSLVLQYFTMEISLSKSHYCGELAHKKAAPAR